MLSPSHPTPLLQPHKAHPPTPPGTPLQAYPEFCRAAYDAAPLGFQIAVAELQNRYGKVGPRVYRLAITPGIGQTPSGGSVFCWNGCGKLSR